MIKQLTIIFILLLAVGCEKDEKLPELHLDYWGTAPSIKNGKLWNPKIHGGKIRSLLGYYGLAFNEYDSGNIRRRTFGISKIPGPEIGIFKVEEVDIHASNRIHAFFATTLDDGDVLGDVFLLDTTKINFIEISEVKGNEVKGSFEVNLKRDSPLSRKYLESDDTLKIECKAFHTRIADK
jgi:hypothetical protein